MQHATALNAWRTPSHALSHVTHAKRCTGQPGNTDCSRCQMSAACHILFWKSYSATETCFQRLLFSVTTDLETRNCPLSGCILNLSERISVGAKDLLPVMPRTPLCTNQHCEAKCSLFDIQSHITKVFLLLRYHVLHSRLARTA